MLRQSDGDGPPINPLSFDCKRRNPSLSDKDALHKHEGNSLAHIAMFEEKVYDQSLSCGEDSTEHDDTHDRETSSAGDEQLRAIMNALGLDGRDRTVSTEDVLDQHERHFPASTSVGRRTHPRSLHLFERGVHKLQATKQKIRHQHTASSWRIVARD